MFSEPSAAAAALDGREVKMAGTSHKEGATLVSNSGIVVAQSPSLNVGLERHVSGMPDKYDVCARFKRHVERVLSGARKDFHPSRFGCKSTC